MIQARNIVFSTLPLPYVDYSTETSISTYPWTATKDAFVLVAITASGTSAGCVVYVNGYRVAQNNNTSPMTAGFFVRKGDIVSKSTTGTVNYTYTYDVKWSS